MGFEPENVIEQIDTRPKHEINEETRQRFEALRLKHFSEDSSYDTGAKKAKYTKEETDSLFNKLEEANKKFKTLDAHRMDFTKPLEMDSVETGTIEFEVPCHVCGRSGYNRMCTCEIPYFKEIIIMAFTCDSCGARSTDVKVGGGIPEKGSKYTLKVEGEAEFNRDLFKSETAAIFIPEIGVEVVGGSLGGVYSTVEGILEKVSRITLTLDARYSQRGKSVCWR